MALENRNLEVGTRLAARYKGQTYSAEVVQTEEGLCYRLEDGREFKSPSSAGSAVMAGLACNGWRFWSLEGELPEPKGRKAEPKPRGVKQARTRKKGKKETTIWCENCGETFGSVEEATAHVAEAHPAQEEPAEEPSEEETVA